jgi:hypothetical protein
MKGSRLVDVLDEKGVGPEAREFWNKIFGKLKILVDLIERTNPSIDDSDLRWCTDRIEYWNSEERLLSKEEMETANSLYRKYK